MIKFTLLGFIAILLLETPFELKADLINWTSKDLELKTRTVPGKYESKFEYKNTSGKTVKFIKIKASCGCVVVEAPKEVKAGETGEIKFKAPIPRAGGKYGKALFVDTDEKDGVEYKLTFTITNTDPYIPRLPKKQTNEATKTSAVTNPYTPNSGYQRPKEMGRRALLVEKLMAKQALARKNNYYKQDECPFLPLPINQKLYHDFEGMRIYTCCEQCLKLVKESPYHAIIKLSEKNQTPILVNKVTDTIQNEGTK